MKATFRLVLGIGLGAAGLLGAAGAALAQAPDVLHGAACVPTGNTHPPGLRTDFRGVRNLGTTVVDVTCPLLRTVAGAFSFNVVVNGDKLTDACHLFSQKANAGQVTSITWPRMQGTTPFRVRAGVPAEVSSFIAVRCVLPPAGRIYNVVLENQ